MITPKEISALFMKRVPDIQFLQKEYMWSVENISARDIVTQLISEIGKRLQSIRTVSRDLHYHTAVSFHYLDLFFALLEPMRTSVELNTSKPVQLRWWDYIFHLKQYLTLKWTHRQSAGGKLLILATRIIQQSNRHIGK